MFSKIGVRPSNLLKRDSDTGVNFLKHVFLRTSLPLKVYAAEKEMIYLNGTSKVNVSR